MNFIDNCECYAFARIGENSEGDIEYRSQNFDDIEVNTYFEDDYSNYKTEIIHNIDYLLTHNKNYTKKQLFAIQELQELIKKI